MTDLRDKQTVRVSVEGMGDLDLPAGENLRRALRSQGVTLDGTCSDKGTCGRCVVTVTMGSPSAPSESERGLLGEDAVGRGDRLACRIPPLDGLRIRIDPERILQLDAVGRWKETFQSPLWREGLWPLSYKGYGLAVDVGTTSVASALYEMASGRPMDIISAANPQVPFGEDILSRLEAALEPAQSAEMARVLWEEITRQIRVLSLRNGLSTGRLSRFVIVGNSAMMALATGSSVKGLLAPPFAPPWREGRTIPAARLPLEVRVAASAESYLPPMVGGYVGSDAVAGCVAAMSGGGKKTGVLLDVGTNTEIVAWSGGRIVAASAPAGPAFEGGHIRAGMKAEAGAVWKALMDEEGVRCEVLGGGRPEGVCGTGLVDLLACLVRAGGVDRTGRLRPGAHPSVTAEGLVFSRYPRLVMTPGDVETLQKAKAAVAAACNSVVRRLGVRWSAVERVYLAGAFGARLDLANAIVIGLLPPLPVDRFEMAGNTALLGASFCLLSAEAQKEADRLGRSIEHLSVADDPSFEEEFIEGLFFPAPDPAGGPGPR